MRRDSFTDLCGACFRGPFTKKGIETDEEREVGENDVLNRSDTVTDNFTGAIAEVWSRCEL